MYSFYFSQPQLLQLPVPRLPQRQGEAQRLLRVLPKQKQSQAQIKSTRMAKGNKMQPQNQITMMKVYWETKKNDPFRFKHIFFLRLVSRWEWWLVQSIWLAPRWKWWMVLCRSGIRELTSSYWGLSNIVKNHLNFQKSSYEGWYQDSNGEWVNSGEASSSSTVTTTTSAASGSQPQSSKPSNGTVIKPAEGKSLKESDTAAAASKASMQVIKMRRIYWNNFVIKFVKARDPFWNSII